MEFQTEKLMQNMPADQRMSFERWPRREDGIKLKECQRIRQESEFSYTSASASLVRPSFSSSRSCWVLRRRYAGGGATGMSTHCLPYLTRTIRLVGADRRVDTVAR